MSNSTEPPGLVALRLRASQETVRRAARGFDEFHRPAPVSISWFEEADNIWSLEILFATQPDRALADAFLGKVFGENAPDYTLSPLPPRDWVAQSLAGLAPVAAGRFLVHGAHDQDRVPAGTISIKIEAGQAFGTGHHATTMGCLLALQFAARRRPVRAVLDLGTGTGVLAIAAARLLRCPVVATDIDPVATQTARANATANHVGPLVTCLTANGVADRRISTNRPYNLVMANILARPLIAIAPTLTPVMARAGVIILSGLLTAQSAWVLSTYREFGYVLKRHFIIDEWSTLLLGAPAGW